MLDPYVNAIEDSVSTVASSLLNRARQEDQAAWDMLIDLHAPLVYRWCRRRGLGPEESRDIGQEVFSSVANSLTGFQRATEKDSFRAWLRRITENKIKDHWKKTNNLPQAAGGSELLNAAASIAPSEYDEEPGAEEKEVFVRILEYAKGNVSKQHWDVFWKVVVEEQDPADVAEQAGLKRSNVYMIKSRILNMLQSLPEFRAGEAG